MGFDLDSDQRRQLGYQLIDRINEYFSSLKDRPVQPPAAQRSFLLEQTNLPEVGQEAAAVPRRHLHPDDRPGISCSQRKLFRSD